MEVTAMTQYVSSAEEEYQSLRKRFNRLENELKGDCGKQKDESIAEGSNWAAEIKCNLGVQF